MCTVCAWCIQRPEEGVGSSGIGSIVSCSVGPGHLTRFFEGAEAMEELGRRHR